MADERRSLVAPRRASTIEMVQQASGGYGFDPDAWHVMNERDNALIQDEILHGAGSNRFVYQFEIAGTKVSGISVVGARHLANHYGGLKHRLVGTIQKVGELFTFTSYPAHGTPMEVRTARIADLAEEDDFYAAIVEIEDIKTGNSIQIERREGRWEKRRDGSRYERPNYATIAQSKAYRNAVLGLIDQAVQLEWKESQLKLGRGETITASVIDEKRSGVLQFAAKHALPLQRDAVNKLTMDQIAGLAEAAREGKVPAFAQAAQSLGLVEAQQQIEAPTQTEKKEDKPKGAKKAEPKAEAADAGPQQGQQQEPPRQEEARTEPEQREEKREAAPPPAEEPKKEEKPMPRLFK